MQKNLYGLLSVKRPLVYGACLVLIATGCALYQWTIWIPIALGVCFYGIFIRLSEKRIQKRAVHSIRTKEYYYEWFYLIVSMVLFIGTYLHSMQKMTMPAYDSMLQTQQKIPCEAVATIQQIIPKEYGFQLYLKNCTITSLQNEKIETSKKTGVLATVDTCPYTIGDVVYLQGKIKKFDAPHNEGEFDAEKYYLSIGMTYQMTVADIQCRKENANRWIEGILAVKTYLKKSYETIALEEDVGLFYSMVLGDKTRLAQDVKDFYQKNGISHLLAISGLHISLIGLTLFRLIRKLGASYPIAAILGTFMVVSYGILTGNAVSTRRAVIMMILMFGAEVCGRTYDIKSALSVAAIILLVDNPYVLYNAAFWLSFGAIIGICVIAPICLQLVLPFSKQYMENRCTNVQQWIRGIVQAMIVSGSVSIVTFPIILYNYYEFPLYSIFLNLIVVPCMSVFMLCAWIAGLIGGVIPQAGICLIGTSHYILRLYEKICTWTQMLPYASVLTGKPSVQAIVGYYIVLFFCVGFFYYQKNVQRKIKRTYYVLPEEKKKVKLREYQFKCEKLQNRYRIGMLIGISIALWIVLYRPVGGMVIDMIDVGQGDGILVQTPERKNYLFDGGSTDIKQVGTYRMIPFFKAKRIAKIDYVFISHSDADHVNGILEIIEEGYPAIGCIVLPGIQGKENDKSYLEIETMANEHKISVHYANAGEQIDKNITCIHPIVNYTYENANDYSATYLIQYEKFKMLMTGDAGEHAETTMLQGGFLSDISVLKVGHHGSKTSSSDIFLDQIKPELALISCGIDNRYGHPAARTIEALDMRQIQTLITAVQGQITVRTDGQQMWIKTKRKKDIQ